MKHKNESSRYSPLVRFTCMALAVLVTSGILVYLVMMLMELFGK